MRPASTEILMRALVLCAAVCFPVLLWGRVGWFASAGVALTGSVWLARWVGARFISPVNQLARHLEIVDDPASTGDVTDLIATEYREAAERLADLEAVGLRLGTALDASREGVMLLDPNRAVAYTNVAARDLLNERTPDAVRRVAQPDLDKLASNAVATGRTVAQDVTLRTPRARFAHARAIPMSDGYVALLLTDRSEAYRLDRLRRDFVANVSHELKTPVAAMHALAEVAATAVNAEDSVHALDFLGRLQTEADRMGKLVADLLDLSRVEGGAKLHSQDVDLLTIVCGAVERAQALHPNENLNIEVVGEPTWAEVDSAQISMAVQNLVENAVRYSDGGTVTVSVSTTADKASIVVSDEGIGIPTGETARIFERFYRVDRARARATGGTGLGLAIVRHVAENHGGRVSVESEFGLGSRFTLTFPCRISGGLST